MISWLEGKVIESWELGLKNGIIIACAGVGYEIQLLSRQLLKVKSSSNIILWVHQIQREDGYSLYGFEDKQERDLFRALISVNGVGPQSAIALLEECNVIELVEAIHQGDYKKLSRAQGVGKRTAERLHVELRNKLDNFQSSNQGDPQQTGPELKDLPLQACALNELQDTLKCLGYEDHEIKKAIAAVLTDGNSNNPSTEHSKTQDIDGLIRATLVWLNKYAS